jgi:hypothetical protein
MSENPEPTPLVSFPCRNLRNKEMYYENPGQAEDDCASGVYWCMKTHEGFGPDGQPVGKTDCCIGRTCYVS